MSDISNRLVRRVRSDVSEELTASIFKVSVNLFQMDAAVAILAAKVLVVTVLAAVVVAVATEVRMIKMFKLPRAQISTIL